MKGDPMQPLRSDAIAVVYHELPHIDVGLPALAEA